MVSGYILICRQVDSLVSPVIGDTIEYLGRIFPTPGSSVGLVAFCYVGIDAIRIVDRYWDIE